MMNAFESTRLRITASVLLALLALSSCASNPTAQDLTGMWSSTTGETFCFSKDGSIKWTSQVQGRSVRYRGTYKIAGNTLTIQAPDLETSPTLRATLRLGKLELTSPSGSTQKYTKVPGSCED
jgi:hypothetical protein